MQLQEQELDSAPSFASLMDLLVMHFQQLSSM